MTNTTTTVGPRKRQVYIHSNGHREPDACGPSLLPYLPMLGTSSWDAAQVHGLQPHCHTTHEICLILEGQVTWWVRSLAGETEVVTLRRGDGFVTLPREEHGGVDTLMHPCALLWLQVDVPGLAASHTDCQALVAALASPHPRRFTASPEVRSAFTKLLTEHATQESLGNIAAHAALVSLLVAVVRDRAQAPAALFPSLEITTALHWMQIHLCENFSVTQAAKAAALTPARFHERFLAEVGQTPGEWRIRERIAQAQERLRLPAATVTDIALSLGFKSSQHFATAFKRYTGQTPTDFRAQCTRLQQKTVKV